MQIPHRNRLAILAAIAAILALAAGLRLYGVGFGLPALRDPDEPLFMTSALTLLSKGTINPGWFGHPGTTTIYALALIDLAVLGIGMASGRYAGTEAFASAIYFDPGILIMPGRLFIVACGVACVLLTFLIGRRLGGNRAGLVAAVLLAVNPLHITWSQVIRTDIHATVFLLLCTLFAIRAAQRGRLSDYLIAGACVGFAAATKWPTATVAVAIAGACLHRCLHHPAERRRQLRFLGLAAVASIAALFVASPYIFLDYQTVLANVSGEAKPRHLGATGGDFAHNIGWYVAGPIRQSMGMAGVALAVLGILVAAARNRLALAIVVPAAAAFLIAISIQHLIWSRWVLPLLPLLAIFAALAIDRIAARFGQWFGRLGGAAIASLILIGVSTPMLIEARAAANERAADTRGLASDWARANIPAGHSLVLEHLALDLLPQPWTVLFPMGDAGCIEASAILRGKFDNAKLAKVRGGSAIVDLGTIGTGRMASCRADFAIISDYDRYLAEPEEFSAEIRNYRLLLLGARQVAVFRPQPRVTGGPVVRIFRLPRASATIPDRDS